MTCCSPTETTGGACCATAETTGVAERSRTTRTRRPNVDIFETQDELVVVAEVPGARPENLEVGFENGVLKIKARVPARDFGAARGVAFEYAEGDFQRSFELGLRIDSARIDATLTDGVLTLKLPKAEASKPRKIEVRPL